MLSDYKERPMMRHTSVWTLHISLLLIIAGGVVTWLSGSFGIMDLVRGETGLGYTITEGYIRSIPFTVRLDSVTVVRPVIGSPPDYRVALTLAGTESRTLALNSPVSFKGYDFCISAVREDDSVGIMVSHDPVGKWIVYAGFILFTVSGLWNRKTLLLSVSATLLSAIPLILLYKAGLIPDLSQRAPVLHTLWLPAHVITVTGGYLLMVATVPAAVARLIHPTEKADERLRALLRAAAVTFGCGIIIGSFWGAAAWGRYWGWDPKEASALIIFIIICIPLHLAYHSSLHRAAAVATLIAAAIAPLIIITGNIFSSLHAY